MAECGDDYAPFDAHTLVRYKEVLKERRSAKTSKADVTTVQQALTALQDRSLVWKESRGVYALEDSNIAELLRKPVERR